MVRDWIWKLEAQGIAWRLTGLGSDLLIMPSSKVEQLDPSKAAQTLPRLVPSDPHLAQQAMRIGDELRGHCEGGTCGDAQDALSAIRDALSRGDLIALRVQAPRTITEAEIRMLEELRRKPSVPAPPLPPRRPPRAPCRP